MRVKNKLKKIGDVGDAPKSVVQRVVVTKAAKTFKNHLCRTKMIEESKKGSIAGEDVDANLHDSLRLNESENILNSSILLHFP